MSAPPLLMMLVASPAPEPPMSEILSGVLKNSEMPFKSALVVEPSSHISRKNAIIAVTKSAYAIFHAPPWWPPAFFLIFLTMMGRKPSSDMTAPGAVTHCGVDWHGHHGLLALGFLDVVFQLGKG